LDTLANIENVEGSNTGNDILTGDENNNILSGFGGNDVLEGGAGDDTLNGGSGNDTADFSGATEEIVIELLTGATTNDGFGSIDTLISIENLIGGGFDDLLWGDSGANILNGGAGADNMAGGDGSDVYFVDNNLDIISETNATVSTGGIDTVYSSLAAYSLGTNIENGNILNSGTANLTGNSLNNMLIGGAGNNILNGAAGNDILIGGNGKDTLTGGLGNDIFDFNAYTELGLGATRDVITDFVRGQDKIDLSTIDPNAALAGNQAFSLITTALTTAGQISYSAGLISINTDTDAAAEFEIQLTGVIPATLAVTDFML
jgi:Ca2+-binding RTX toxin-like protein